MDFHNHPHRYIHFTFITSNNKIPNNIIFIVPRFIIVVTKKTSSNKAFIKSPFKFNVKDELSLTQFMIMGYFQYKTIVFTYIVEALIHTSNFVGKYSPENSALW